MIYACFESILLLEKNGKQNPNEPYTSKYQEHIAFSQDYKLIRADDKFNKLFKSYLGEDAVCNFINNTVKGNKSCSEVMKKHCKKNL